MNKVIKAYFYGLLGDAMYSRLHKTWRIAQREREWLEKLQLFLKQLGYRAWIYQEGRKRRVFVLETTAKFLSAHFEPASLIVEEEKIAYIRGYFDAEGGVPQNSNARFYIQFVQKNRKELEVIRKLLQDLGIETGEIHNPSVKIDPE